MDTDHSAIQGENAANLAAIQAIQNNTNFTAAVPLVMDKPDASNEAFRWACNVYDTDSAMEDPVNSEVLIRVIKDDGTNCLPIEGQSLAL